MEVEPGAAMREISAQGVYKAAEQGDNVFTEIDED